MTFGVAEKCMYGHRGYSHSLLFAAAVAVLAWAVVRRWGKHPLLAGILTFVAVCSHGVLDAMTFETRGIPFFWPFTEMRVKFPWRPIPPAPTGMAFVSRWGLEVAAIELLFFAPVIIISLLPKKIADRLLALPRTVTARRARPAAQIPAAPVAPVAPAPVVTLASPRPRAWPAALRLAGVVTAIALSLMVADRYLRHWQLVAWIERLTPENMALSMHKPPQQHQRHVR